MSEQYKGLKVSRCRDTDDSQLQELDEAVLNGLIKDTNVLQTKEYASWKWSLLCSMLQHPGLKNSHLQEDSLYTK